MRVLVFGCTFLLAACAGLPATPQDAAETRGSQVRPVDVPVIHRPDGETAAGW